MAAMTTTSHQELILDQFTRQAIPFSNAKTIADENALRLLVEFSDAGPRDRVLDVACGGGLVVCAFAQVVQHATGIDVTPAMLDRSRALARDKGMSNVSWKQGDVESLPYPDGAFTIVVSRFTFHHFQNPLAVLEEMVRVCAPGGRVVVADVAVSADAAKAAQFNRMEILRDPSHVRAMPAGELRELFRTVGLPEPRTTAYELRDELENLLRRSFPNPGDDQKIREIFAASALDDRLGIPCRRQENQIHYAYPVTVLAAVKPSSGPSGARAR
jgi:ubiquinone/menaquinone biosynthesis C-methylase UbiE